jgi:hypothetical protein
MKVIKKNLRKDGFTEKEIEKFVKLAAKVKRKDCDCTATLVKVPSGEWRLVSKTMAEIGLKIRPKLLISE